MGVEWKGRLGGEGSRLVCFVKLRFGCGEVEREIVRNLVAFSKSPPPLVIHTQRHIRERGGFREGAADNGDSERAQEGKRGVKSAPL